MTKARADAKAANRTDAPGEEERPLGEALGEDAADRAGPAAGGEDPAPQDGRAGDGPSIEDLVPGLDEALAAEDGQAARIADLEAENAQIKDRLLRALADLENTRRRAERDRKDAEAYGGTRLARDLLAVHDNLARALAAADDELREKHGAFIEGVELTQRELLKAFAKHRIEKVSPEPGEKFDPNLHQAVFEAPIPSLPNGSVAEVMEAGFTIAGRLLRPAMVGVARGGAPAAAQDARPEPKQETVDAQSGGGEADKPEG